ncbi:MAG: flagellar biosynthetic protein FliQ [Myxococcota bacterium]
MADAAIMNVVREGLVLAAMLSLPVLIACLVTGAIVSLLQAVTQVQDQAVSFVPKLLVVAIVLAAGGPAALRQLFAFARALFMSIGRI